MEVTSQRQAGEEVAAPLSKADYERLAEFRYALRQFLSYSERTAREAGILPQQYQALLAVKGYPGRSEVTVGELAERLQLRHHTVVELIDRMEAQTLVERKAASHDRRQVYVKLTERGEHCLALVAGQNREKLRELQIQICDFLAR